MAKMKRRSIFEWPLPCVVRYDSLYDRNAMDQELKDNMSARANGTRIQFALWNGCVCFKP